MVFISEFFCVVCWSGVYWFWLSGEVDADEFLVCLRSAIYLIFLFSSYLFRFSLIW